MYKFYNDGRMIRSTFEVKNGNYIDSLSMDLISINIENIKIYYNNFKKCNYVEFLSKEKMIWKNSFDCKGLKQWTMGFE